MKLLDISSVAESPSNEWVAIQVENSAGSNLILVNLKTGNYTIINERLEKAGKQNVETISSYNWSPKEEHHCIFLWKYGEKHVSNIRHYERQCCLSPSGNQLY